MHRSSSLYDFVTSLDDEISLPYLSMSVSLSHHGLEVLDTPPTPAETPSPVRRVAQPDADFEAERWRPPSRSHASPRGRAHAKQSLADAQSADESRNRFGFGGLTLTYPNSLNLESASLKVDYALPRSHEISFTIAPAKLRIRKRTLLWLLLTFKISMVVGLCSHGAGMRWPLLAASGFIPSLSAMRPALSSVSNHRAGVRGIAMVSSLHGGGGGGGPLSRARPAAGGSAAFSSAFGSLSLPSAHPVVHLATSAVGALAGSLNVAFDSARAFSLDEALDGAMGQVSELQHEVDRVASSCLGYAQAQIELAESMRDALSPSVTAAAHWWAPGMPGHEEAELEAVGALGVSPSGVAAGVDGLTDPGAEGEAEMAAAVAAVAVGSYPVGFDRHLAMQLSILCGISYHCALDPDAPSPTTAADTARMAAELEEQGLELVQTYRDSQLDTFAFLAAEKSHEKLGSPPSSALPLAGARKLFLIFRGSVSALNKDLNFDFFRCGYDAAEDCFDLGGTPAADGATGSAAQSGGATAAAAAAGEDEGAATDPSAVLVHRGFLRAWQSLRAGVLDSIRRIGQAEGRAGRDVELYVSGHSLGGAMAMLASSEIAHLARKYAPSRTAAREGISDKVISLISGKPRAHGTLVQHKLYTFAAPRLGNDKFASKFEEIFCSNTSYWAVQSGGDAVPHLPLQAMGFSHPTGRIVTLNKYGRQGVHLDTGDDRLRAWVPRGLNPENWVRTHDIISYGSELAALARWHR